MNVLCYEKNILIGFLISFSKLFRDADEGDDDDGNGNGNGDANGEI